MMNSIHDNRISCESAAKHAASSLVTRVIRVYGIVQGVGFRPTVSRHAAASGIKGTVCNKGPYVEIIAQGNAAQCDAFLELLKTAPPKRASILRIDTARLKPAQSSLSLETKGSVPIYTDFTIIESTKTRGAIYISPDIAVCDDCKRELYDKTNRRYLHPFINCTNCGPRMTILDALPYDRERTSMKIFPMCKTCSHEYHAPDNRRFDAQPVCCNQCGPRVYILDKAAGVPDETLTEGHAITKVRETIINGGIAAIKGIGGFHLCCDAANEAAVRLLRQRKHRAAKPFAVMMKDLATAKRECLISDSEQELLTGHQKPIVLLRRKRCIADNTPDCTDSKCSVQTKCGNRLSAAACSEAAVNQDSYDRPIVAPNTAPDNPKLGVMLPYAPIQLLIFDYDDGLKMPDCLVMTSANESGAPICRDDAAALNELSELADVILSNDRLIRVRADDTVTDFYNDEPYMIRRSRGFAPLPVLMSACPDSACSVLGIGGELKNSFCLGRGQLFYPSPYVGDLGDIRTVDALRETIKRFETLLELKPGAICCDMHPLYQSRALAYELADELAQELNHKIQVFELQHHYAHILSCMAENDYDGSVIGVSFDGTGYGTDGSIWGGEILRCDWQDFERISHISEFVQVGGDISAREGWRIAAQMIGDIYEQPEEITARLKLCGPEEITARLKLCSPEEIAVKLKLCSAEELRLIRQMSKHNINSVKSTSAGRLFDAVSAILGIRKVSDFEGEASTALMYKALEYDGKEPSQYPYPLLTEDGLLNTIDLVRYIIDERLAALLANSKQAGFDTGYDAKTYGDLKADCCHEADTVRLADSTSHLKTDTTVRLAYIFHKVLADMITAAVLAASKQTGINTAALSGGVFQNTLLLKLAEEQLTAGGIKVLRHHLIPPNDGGIGLGQAVYAMKRISGCAAND